MQVKPYEGVLQSIYGRIEKLRTLFNLQEDGMGYQQKCIRDKGLSCGTHLVTVAELFCTGLCWTQSSVDSSAPVL